MKFDGPGNQALLALCLGLQILWVIIYSIPSLLLALYYCFVPRPLKDVKGEVVMITGSGQGLGRELCLAFARLGAELICVDLIADKNQETVKLIRDVGGTARGYLCDVSDRTAIIKLAQEVGRVDILVNNAAIYPIKGLWNATEQEIRRIVDINLLSQFWAAQAFLPDMKKRNHGHFVSISSLSAVSGFTYMEPYATTKSALTGLTMTLAHEMRTEKKDVKITIVYPYFVNTKPEMNDLLKDHGAPILAMQTRGVARATVKGILENRRSFSVPDGMLAGIHFLSHTPDVLWNKMYNTFYPFTIKENMNIGGAHEDILKIENTGTIQAQI